MLEIEWVQIAMDRDEQHADFLKPIWASESISMAAPVRSSTSCGVRGVNLGHAFNKLLKIFLQVPALVLTLLQR